MIDLQTPSLPDYRALNMLSVPVWIVSSRSNEFLFSNVAAGQLSAGADLTALRHGSLSAHSEEQLALYLPALRAREPVIEIWTIVQNGEAVPLSCQLSMLKLDTGGELILVEGIRSSLPTYRPPICDLTEHTVYGQLFHSNGAPMLLIDPADDGRIVDANHAACRFYRYTREGFCRRHTWEINALGRLVLPIMSEVAKLPGGHKPLNFIHRLADGSLRDVQTYASPLEMDGKRLMVCVVHDVTEQKRLKSELEYAASRDPLTGLLNRRLFLGLLDSARQQKRRVDMDYCLMILDADHFKRINDTLGHLRGDEVLVVLAKTLEKRVRESDAVCRWGGEEFTILLPQTGLDNAAHLAESLRLAVAAIHIPDLPRVTVSIGVAQQQPEETTESLIKRADAALYQAKDSGRNRVCLG